MMDINGNVDTNLKVYENDFYQVRIVHQPNKEGGYKVYGVVNTRYNVVEAFIASLPAAIAAADFLEQELHDIYETDKAPRGGSAPAAQRNPLGSMN